MIGVIAKDSERRAAEEFFELFKTPWEFYVSPKAYDVLLVASNDVPPGLTAGVLLLYNSRPTSLDEELGVAVQSKQAGGWLEWNDVVFPLYGKAAALEAIGRPFVFSRGAPEVTGLEVDDHPRRVVRIGYNLFEEVALLLSQGQPPENAHIPALEIHISLLRSILVSNGVSFVEIPPVPAGYDFMACLTHDVDFTGIRSHKFDHTMWGFLYRASLSSLIDACRGRISWRRLFQNWKAVVSLPLVLLGLLRDFWLEFDRFIQIEKNLGSTFFFIPFNNTPGMLAPKRRAVKYDVTGIKEQVRRLADSGCEVGLHGIDAWRDSASACAERNRISEVTGQSEMGVRMHWLYFSENSPKTLEEAGLSYDSTIGYNEAIGFRAGTAQAFCLPLARTLLELPLIIQDTAMFYPGRMHLSETEALDSCKRLIHFTALFGGALTVNWHTRSLSPERLWGEFYASLLKEIQNRRVRFDTAREVVAWFRARRALRFEKVEFDKDSLRIKFADSPPNGHTSFLLRVYRPDLTCSTTPPSSVPKYSDRPWNGQADLQIVA